MGALTLSQVTKSFGKTDVIKGVDLNVDEGEFCVFVGPSGCGKSTLLRMIAGLEDVTSGEVALDGVRINDLAPARREIAMVFQSYALYPHLSVRDNMGLALKQAGVAKAEIAQATEPDLFLRQAAPHDVAGEVGVGPQEDQVVHVAGGDGGKGQAVGGQDGGVEIAGH